jgi:2',3'-cyclic-nucleotide 2'-phosphodiesterase (5'-nucleotidase family)
MRDGAFVLVDAGDMFQGTIASNGDEGATVVAAYNSLGYDAAAVGNHEFDYGPEGEASFAAHPGENPRGALLARAREARFPFLAANFSEGEGLWQAQNLRASTVREVRGVRVGIIGVSTIHTPETTLSANVRGLAMLPLAASIVREATTLRRDGAAVVILFVLLDLAGVAAELVLEAVEDAVDEVLALRARIILRKFDVLVERYLNRNGREQTQFANSHLHKDDIHFGNAFNLPIRCSFRDFLLKFFAVRNC